jgi:hypothetical protein
MSNRHGTILLIVAGLASILAMLTLAFIAQMRSDAEESMQFAQDVQARAMLTAGLNYIQETSRLGWNDETFGWWDPRDGRAGPKDITGKAARHPITGMPLFDTTDDPLTDGHGPTFPGIGGTAARCPMYCMRRPPWAVSNDLTPNPVVLETGLTWDKLVNADKPNPKPVAANWTDFANGDTTPMPAKAQPAWFRIYRKEKATFIVTCGSGNSLGFRDWTEVETEGQQDVFGSEAEFNAIRAAEVVLWYEAEWNSAVGTNTYYHYKHGTFEVGDISSPRGREDEKNNSRQFGGVFTYIERLPKIGETVPPPQW